MQDFLENALFTPEETGDSQDDGKDLLNYHGLGHEQDHIFFNSPIFPIAAVFILLPLYSMPILIESDLNHLCL